MDIDEYYKLYFYARRNDMGYRIDGGTIHDLLTKNIQGVQNYRSSGNANSIELWSAIRSAADEFFVIERGKTDIVVPYGESMRIVDEYSQAQDFAVKRNKLRELRKYTVSLYSYQIKELTDKGALFKSSPDEHGLTILAEGFYDTLLGVDIDGSHEFLCV